MDTVFSLSPKGRRECAAEQPLLLRELHALLRMVDGRRTRADLLNSVGRNAITTGGLRWLLAAGYIFPDSATTTRPAAGGRATRSGAASELLASVPLDLPSFAAPMASPRGEPSGHEALADFMLRSIERHLGDTGAPYRWRVERAAQVPELLPLLNPLLEAILARAGRTAAGEFAHAAALLLQPLENGAP